MTFWDGILWLHLLAMAFFVGGQLMLAAVVVPILRGVQDGRLLRSANRRFFFGTVAAGVVLVASGSAMATHYHRWGDSALQVKLVLVALVAVLVGAHMHRSNLRVLEPAIFLSTLAIVWLGIVVAN